MLVSELIEKLEKFPTNAEVLIPTGQLTIICSMKTGTIPAGITDTNKAVFSGNEWENSINSQNKPKIGSKDICQECGNEIIFIGSCWDHIGMKLRHPPFPALGAKALSKL